MSLAFCQNVLGQQSYVRTTKMYLEERIIIWLKLKKENWALFNNIVFLAGSGIYGDNNYLYLTWCVMSCLC